MMRLYEGQIVYVKKEHLEDFLPNTFAEKYNSFRKRMAKVLEWTIVGGPGTEDPVMVSVQMLEDGEIWFFPLRMIYCRTDAVSTRSCYTPPDPGGDYDGDYADRYKNNVYTYTKIATNTLSAGYCCDKYTKEFEKSMAKGEFKAMKYAYRPVKIIYNDPATIVFWRDGTKTVVRRMEKEQFNPYTAFCAALAKKVFGNNSAVNRIVNSGYNQLIGDILKAGKQAKAKEKAIDKKDSKFIRDEKGRWVSAKAKKKEKKAKT